MNTLPYSLPIRWLRHMALFTVTSIKCMPMKQRHLWHSPKEMFTGIKINFKWNWRICFGEYVQVFKPLQIPNTYGALSLAPTSSISGSVRFMSLRTLKLIVRTQWTVLCIPQMLDNLTSKQSSVDSKNIHINQNPVFKRGNPVIEETVLTNNENELLCIPEITEGPGRAPTKMQLPLDEEVDEFVSK